MAEWTLRVSGYRGKDRGHTGTYAMVEVACGVGVVGQGVHSDSPDIGARSERVEAATALARA